MSRLDRWQEPEAATAAFASRGFASAADKAKQLTRAARRLAAAEDGAKAEGAARAVTAAGQAAAA